MQDAPNDGDFEMIKELNRTLGLPKKRPMSKTHNRLWWCCVILMVLFPIMLMVNSAVNYPVLMRLKHDVAELKARDETKNRDAQHVLYMFKLGVMEWERECARILGQRGKSRQYMEAHCTVDFGIKDPNGQPVK
jgi:hypothetical protein